jgi:hypothetical protein
MAQALREAYPTLFQTFPDAFRKDDEALRNYFSTHTDVGAKAVSYMVRTFKSLVALADFEADAPVEEELEEDNGGKLTKVSKDSSDRKVSTKVQEATGNSLTINVNIQLQIPATEDATIYDKFFESLYKHILSKGDE